MGNWHISIEGVGSHHNKDYPSDADKMAAEFVDLLKGKGHTITKASFTYGGSQGLGDCNNIVGVDLTKLEKLEGCGVYLPTPSGKVFISSDQLAELAKKP